ncbi:MAG: polysaccharide pyruvyl transferase family protein [Cyanophyceae cyanobacterium]
MRLCYFERDPNFGDALNPWLWKKLLPDLINNDDRLAFVGIGTLINNWLPKRTSYAKKRVIFGTGAGYNQPYVPDDSFRVYCLRGPLSAQALNLPESLGITDAGVLFRAVYQATEPKRYPFSYIPHYQSSAGPWQQICDDIGFGYIDPCRPVDEVLTLISQSEVVVTEAMHGAIISDALRAPWIPVKTNPAILPFKWNDWCKSVDQPYVPNLLELVGPSSSARDWKTPLRRVKHRLKRGRVAKALRRIANESQPYLSSDRRIESLTQQMLEKLEQFQQDLKTDPFFESVR